MRQIYYSIRTLLRERGTNIIRVISLSLGLTIGILLFSQIAFELSYERCYPEPERLAIARCLTTNLSTGETMGDDGNNYDYTLFDVVASTLAQDMPEEIEFASCVLTGQGMSIYYEGYTTDEVRRRSKEIAIRKVNGSEATGILELLVKDVLYVAVVAVLIGVVAAWYVNGMWMDLFAEHVPLSWAAYLLIAIANLAVIVACVLWKSWKIANENPVNSIKSE